MRMQLPVVLLLASAIACGGGAREYELHGQVIAVNPQRQEITIAHEDIPGFMPGMTMPFKVRDPKLLEGRVPGDLVRARLAVEDATAYLTQIERTGHSPLASAPPGAPAPLLAEGDEVPDVTLTDQAGAARRFSEWRGHTTAVTFIYTRCPLPDFCPRMDRNFAELQRAILADPALRDRLRLVSISFDPQYDTPAVLAAHARRAGADPSVWTFVTGEQAAIDPFAQQFGVSIIRPGEDLKEIVHNLRTAVIDRDGRIVEIYTGNEWRPGEVLAAMRRAGE